MSIQAICTPSPVAEELQEYYCTFPENSTHSDREPTHRATMFSVLTPKRRDGGKSKGTGRTDSDDRSFALGWLLLSSALSISCLDLFPPQEAFHFTTHTILNYASHSKINSPMLIPSVVQI